MFEVHSAGDCSSPYGSSVDQARAVTWARARLRASGGHLAVAIMSEKPLDPPPDGRDADCFKAVVVDDHQAVEFLVCTDELGTVPRLTLVGVIEETLIERFGPDAAAILENVRVLYLSGS